MLRAPISAPASSRTARENHFAGAPLHRLRGGVAALNGNHRWTL